MDLYIKWLGMVGKWLGLSNLCAPLRGHSLRGLFFVKSRPLFLKSAFLGVFLIKPVKEIYRQDEGRMESFEEALKVHKILTETYNKSGLKTISLPFTTPLARLDLILKHIKNG